MVAKPKKRKVRSSKAVQNQQILENDQIVETPEPLEEKSTASSIHKVKTKKQINLLIRKGRKCPKMVKSQHVKHAKNHFPKNQRKQKNHQSKKLS